MCWSTGIVGVLTCSSAAANSPLLVSKSHSFQCQRQWCYSVLEEDFERQSWLDCQPCRSTVYLNGLGVGIHAKTGLTLISASTLIADLTRSSYCGMEKAQFWSLQYGVDSCINALQSVNMNSFSSERVCLQCRGGHRGSSLRLYTRIRLRLYRHKLAAEVLVLSDV